MSEITNNEDVIDSRDIIARIDELEDMFQACQHCMEDLPLNPDHRDDNFTELYDCPACGGEIMSEEEREELDSLEAVKNECEGYSDWKYGEALINEMYFTEYCMDMLKDCGDLPQDIPDYIVIDEEQTAENLKVDYIEVDFDGIAYLMRSA